MIRKKILIIKCNFIKYTSSNFLFTCLHILIRILLKKLIYNNELDKTENIKCNSFSDTDKNKSDFSFSSLLLCIEIIKEL